MGRLDNKSALVTDAARGHAVAGLVRGEVELRAGGSRPYRIPHA